MTRGLLLPGILLTACGTNGEPTPGPPPVVDPATAPAAPADSQILSVPNGVTVWFTEGRRATDSVGQPCYERTIEIRRDTTRIKVPLLYTITTPVLLNDSTLRARLAHNCQPAETYRVDLRTGRPTPERISN